MKYLALSKIPGWYKSLPRWVDVLWLALVVIGFFVAWASVIGVSSIDFDEGFSAYIARFAPLEIAYYTALDVHPPLYYIVLHYWSLILGNDVATLRFLSVIWGGVSIVFAFLLVRSGFGRAAAWLATPLLAASPLFFHYSGIMRMYSMAVAICFAATYVLVRLATTTSTHRRRWLWGLYGVLVSAGMWTNYFTALIWVTHMAWLLFDQYRGMNLRNFVRNTGWAKSMLLAVALFLPWLPAFLFRFAEVQVSGFWIKPISLDTLPSTLSMSTIYQTAGATHGWLAVLLAGGLVLLVVGLRRLITQTTGRQKPLLRLMIVLSIAPVALLIIMSLPPLTSSYVYRYILPALCFGALLVGIVIVRTAIQKQALLKKATLYLATFAVAVSGSLHSIAIGNQNLDSGKVTLMNQMVAKLETIAGDTPILVWSPYTYYIAAAYETPDRPIYFAYNQELETIGSLRMLADHPNGRSVKDVATFAKEHGSLWILAEERASANQSPVPGWRQARSIKLTDPVTGKQPAIAVEYRP